MKKKGFLIIVSVLFVIVALYLYKNSSFYIGSDNYLSGSTESDRILDVCHDMETTKNGISLDFNGFTGKWSLFKLKPNKDSEITISTDVNIKEGLFYIVVLDSDYNLVKKIDVLEDTPELLKFDSSKNNTYFVRIIGNNAVGNFNLKVNNITNIELNYIDFFSA